MAYGEVDKSKITVTMSLEDFEYYRNAATKKDELIRMLERANKDGNAVMTDELRETIEEIYC